VKQKIVWSLEAYRSLQKIWEDAFDREAIAHAIDEIQTSLAENAFETGESRPDGSRVYFASPLGIAFLANDRTTEVEIRAVWTYRRV
jgi:hypothetical protein